MIGRTKEFFGSRIWEIRLTDIPAVKNYGITVLRVILLACRGFMADGAGKQPLF
jgi:hypothetical protein